MGVSSFSSLSGLTFPVYCKHFFPFRPRAALVPFYYLRTHSFRNLVLFHGSKMIMLPLACFFSLTHLFPTRKLASLLQLTWFPLCCHSFLLCAPEVACAIIPPPANAGPCVAFSSQRLSYLLDCNPLFFPAVFPGAARKLCFFFFTPHENDWVPLLPLFPFSPLGLFSYLLLFFFLCLFFRRGHLEARFFDGSEQSKSRVIPFPHFFS